MSGFQTLAANVGARPRWRGDKLGDDGLTCPVCGEPKLGIDYAPHHLSEREWIVKVNCRTCGRNMSSKDYLKRLAGAVGMTAGEILTGNDGLGTRYRRTGAQRMPSVESVYGWNGDLLADPERLAYVTEGRGVSLDEVRGHLIGHDGSRYTLPVFDHDAPFEVIVNLRRYLPDAPPGVPKMTSLAGAGVQLYGAVPDSTWLVICEGEWDMLRASSLGIPAITNTAGASPWKDEWTERIGRRHVCVVYDRDDGGELGEARVRESFERVGLHLSLTVVRLPMPYKETGGYDLSDYLADHTGADLMDLLRRSWKARHARSPGRSRDPHRARPIATAKRRSEVGS